MDHSEVDVKWQKFSRGSSVSDYLDYKKTEHAADVSKQEQ